MCDWILPPVVCKMWQFWHKSLRTSTGHYKLTVSLDIYEWKFRPTRLDNCLSWLFAQARPEQAVRVSFLSLFIKFSSTSNGLGFLRLQLYICESICNCAESVGNGSLTSLYNLWQCTTRFSTFLNSPRHFCITRIIRRIARDCFCLSNPITKFGVSFTPTFGSLGTINICTFWPDTWNIDQSTLIGNLLFLFWMFLVWQ